MSTNSGINILPDLKKLLPKTINDQVSVVSCKTSSLLPPGENFASSILKVEVAIKITASSPEEKLQLVAKMVPGGEFTKSAFKIDVSFGKEIFVFEKLAVTYREIEKQTKLGDKENLRDLFPKFYGGHLTRNEKQPGQADDNAILLLENVKVLGYDTMDRKKGLDLEHAKVAITELARYHALGIALKTHKPALFEESKKYMKFPFEILEDEFQVVIDHTMDLLRQDSRICNYVDRIRSNFIDFKTHMEFEADEPWVSINHGDFWINNIMFCHGKNGIEGVKFVDFQLTRVCNPIFDVPYFLCGSTNPEVLDKNFDELLDIYYSRFIEVLKKTNCDYSLFTRDSFEGSLKRIAKKNIIRIIIAVKFFTLQVSEGTDARDVKTSVLLSGGSKLYLDRVWNIVKKYLEKNWL